MGKRDDKPKAGKAAPAAGRGKTAASAKARQPVRVASSRAASVKVATKTAVKPAAAKAAPKPAVKVVAKAGAVKPTAKAAVIAPVPAAAPKARAVTKAAQKQTDKKLVDRAKASAIVLPADYRPSEDEPFMNEYQRLYFRQKLVSWKEDIIRQTKETIEGLHEDNVQHADLADRATSETDRALELRARDRQRKLVSKIDAALARIEDGTYGYCEETGEPIGLKRLDARPIATLSLEAQERHERRERVYRED